MLKQSIHALPLTLLFWYLVACSQSVTTMPYQPCELVGTQPSDLESTDLTGFSGAAVLENLNEPVSVPITYENGGRSVLTARITYANGSVQEVEKVLNGYDDGLSLDEPCTSYINIETNLTLTTEDGLLNLVETVQLHAFGLNHAIVNHEVLSGALDALWNAAAVDTSSSDRIRYYLNNTWHEGTISGDARATVEPGANPSASSESITTIELKGLADW
ncbi:MAG: hypothetical protein HOI23_14475 [Deltaproteobacteria bacterium]|jgi:hypothetical protein|nr:hypothetical protein [Deltaproteobacteria bacterium]MBT6490725.1 hypothetical protein [Deltaproteobacteria bacterium]